MCNTDCSPGHYPRDDTNAIKGFLIILVVVGHSTIADRVIPLLQPAVYSFHVQCFLLLPFLFASRPLNRKSLGDAAARYMVPYGFAVILYSIPYGLARGVRADTWLLSMFRGLLSGNANFLKETTGFYLLWFLPALFVTIVLRSFIHSQRRRLRYALLCGTIVAHLLLPAMPWSWRRYWPFVGLHIAVFILPLGLCVHAIAATVYARVRGRGRFVLPLLFAVVLWIILRHDHGPNIGNLAYASYRNLPVLVAQDLVALLAFSSLLVFSRELARIPYLSIIGSNSLVIYLLSQIFVAGTTLVLTRGSTATGIAVPAYVIGSSSVVCGVLAPMLVVKLLDTHTKFRGIVLPRSREDFLRGWGLIHER